jgi:hypothetical protein
VQATGTWMYGAGASPAGASVTARRMPLTAQPAPR